MESLLHDKVNTLKIKLREYFKHLEGNEIENYIDDTLSFVDDMAFYLEEKNLHLDYALKSLSFYKKEKFYLKWWQFYPTKKQKIKKEEHHIFSLHSSLGIELAVNNCFNYPDEVENPCGFSNYMLGKAHNKLFEFDKEKFYHYFRYYRQCKIEEKYCKDIEEYKKHCETLRKKRELYENERCIYFDG